MTASDSQIGATALLSKFAEGLTYSNLPSTTIHAARRAVVNILGCCLGGARHEIVEITSRALLPLGGAATATLLGHDKKTDLLTATLINCLSSAAYAFDDTHAETILHPSGAVATTLLALAETTPLSGEDFLLAFIAGIEISSRVSKAVSTSPATYDIGWSQTGIAAGLGAAAAAAKALGLDAHGIASAIGLAAIQSSGLRVAHGTMSSTLIVGHAGQCGLRAALLAQAGLGAPAKPLEGQHGFTQLFSSQPHLPYLTDNLGSSFEVESLTYKPYPYGIVVHPAIDGALEWLKTYGHNPDQIQNIQLHVHPNALALGSRRHPSTPLEAKVSLTHGTAAALVFSRAGLAEVDYPAITDTRVVRLRNLIHLQSDTGLSPESARLEVTLSNGTQQTVEISHCRGSIDNPMSDEDLTVKFLGQAQLCLSSQQASELADACWHVDTLPQVRSLVQLAQPKGNSQLGQ
jgi:2-methylcitrate dehydratase PrpD